MTTAHQKTKSRFFHNYATVIMIVFITTGSLLLIDKINTNHQHNINLMLTEKETLIEKSLTLWQEDTFNNIKDNLHHEDLHAFFNEISKLPTYNINPSEFNNSKKILHEIGEMLDTTSLNGLIVINKQKHIYDFKENKFVHSNVLENRIKPYQDIIDNAWEGNKAVIPIFDQASDQESINNGNTVISKHHPVIYLIFPIKGHQEETQSLIGFEVTPQSSLFKLLKTVENDITKISIYDENNNLATISNHGVDNFPNIEFLNKDGNNLAGYINTDNNRVIGKWRWHNPLNLGVLIEVDYAQAYELYDITRQLIVFSAFLISALIIILQIFHIRKNKQLNIANSSVLYEKDMISNVLNTLHEHIVILDIDGNILMTNSAWNEFGDQNGIRNDYIFNKANYFDVLKKSKVDTSIIELTNIILEKFNLLRTGKIDSFTERYPCHSPTEKRWFKMTARLMHCNNVPTITVSHSNITELVNHETQLSKISDEVKMLSLVAKKTKNAVIITDAQGKIEWVNQGFEDITGYTLEESKGIKPGSFLQGKKTGKDIRKKISDALQKQESVEGEILNYHKDGSPFWIEFEIKPVFDKAGQLKQFIAVEQDITEKKSLLHELQQEQELTNKANKLLSITKQGLENSKISEFWTDLKTGKVLRVNHQACNMLGYSENELISMHISDFDPLADPAFIEETTEMIKKMGAFRFETAHRTSDGKIIPVEVHSHYRKNIDDKDEIIVNFVTDISERKAIEKEIVHNKERLEVAASAGIIGIWEWDLQTNNLYWDSAMHHLWGQEESYTPNPDDMLNHFIYKEDKQLIKTLLDKAFKNRENFKSEFRINWHDGSLHTLKVASKAFYENNTATRLIGVCYDMTEQRLAQETLYAARSQAIQANQAKSNFLATMSHEIRTPLNGIVGTIDLLNHQQLTKEQQGLVDTAIHSAKLLQGIIDDVLDFSKIEAEKLVLESVAINIHDIIAEIASNLKAQISESNIDLLFYINPEIPELIGDPVRIKQILFNLLGNAIKFSKNLPDRNGRVLLSIDKNHNEFGEFQLLINVIDNGIGIDPETQEKLFKPFVQGETDTVRRFGGTGLGLVITSRLVEAMNGNIKVSSDKDQGTHFSLNIPIKTTDKFIFKVDNKIEGKLFIICSDDFDVLNILYNYLSFSGATVIKSTSKDLPVKLKTIEIDNNNPIVLFDTNNKPTNPEEVITRYNKDFDAELKFIFLTLKKTEYSANTQAFSLNGLLPKDFYSKINTLINTSPSDTSASPATHSDDPLEKTSCSDIFSRSHNILLVEDNDINQKVLSSQLESLGCKCDLANNGIEALKIFNSGHYDLILTDCHMPRMDGYDLTWTIRQQEKNVSHIPIIAITADALKGTKDKCLKYGMDDYLTKPIDLDNLKTILSKWISHHSTKDENIMNSTRKTKPYHNDDIVNINTLSELLGIDDRSTLAEYYNDFATSSKKIVAEIKSLNPEHQGNDISGCAHKLKSASRTIGAITLANTCLALEAAGKAMDQEAINNNIQDLYNNFDDVLKWINNFHSLHDETNTC